MGDRVGLAPLGEGEACDRFFCGVEAAGGVEGDLPLSLEVEIVAGVVAEDHHMLLRGVLEEVEDPLAGQESGDKVEVRFVELGAVFQLNLISPGAEVEAAGIDHGFREDGGDNLLHTLVLKDAAVLFEGEKP